MIRIYNLSIAISELTDKWFCILHIGNGKLRLTIFDGQINQVISELFKSRDEYNPIVEYKSIRR